MTNPVPQAAIVSCALTLLAGGLAAQNSPSGGPSVHSPVHFDIGPAMRDMKNVLQTPGPAFVKQLRSVPRPKQALVTDPVVQAAGGAPLIPATSNNFLGVGDGFSGPQGAFSVTGAPSDSNMAIGVNYIVDGVNTSYAVFNKSGTVLQGPVAFSALFNGAGGCQNTNYSDPVVQYDRQADRWVLSILAFASASSGPYYYCIAVSTSSDPTGSYARYAYSFTNLPDYPKMGVWPDGYYATFNMFQGNSFLGSQVCAYDRAKMLTAQTAAGVCFSTTSADGGLLPADLDGSTAPPAGAPNYQLSLAAVANTLSLWKFHADFATPANSTFSGPINLAVASFNLACGNTGGTCVPQSGTSTQLDTLGDRLMYRLGYRNLGDHESLVANHSVDTGTNTAVRWYEIRSPNTNPMVYQQGTYSPDSSHRWMGSIAMDQAGNLGMGFSVSSSSLHPQIHYTGRLAGDTIGLMTQGEASIIDGAGSQTTYFCLPFLTCALTRWGDYSAMRLDPADDCTFWFTSQYLNANGSFNWRTRIGSFRFSSCGAALLQTTTTVASNSNPSVYGTAVQFTATVSPGAATGTVTFKDGASTLGTSPLSGGLATLQTSTLTGGTHSITAVYNGDSVYAASTSSALSQVVNPAPTTTTLTSAPNPSASGQSVTFTASLSPSAATGTVTFSVDGIAQSTVAVSGGQAKYTTSSLTAGTHNVSATYNGDTNYSGSTSNTVVQTVNSVTATSTSLVSSQNPSVRGTSVTFTATVTPSAATGSVQFLDGSTVMGTVTLSLGKAAFSTSTLSQGNHQITAKYLGNGTYSPSTSNVVSQKVNRK